MQSMNTQTVLSNLDIPSKQNIASTLPINEDLVLYKRPAEMVESQS
jgi:hypothetical protein